MAKTTNTTPMIDTALSTEREPCRTSVCQDMSCALQDGMQSTRIWPETPWEPLGTQQLTQRSAAVCTATDSRAGGSERRGTGRFRRHRRPLACS